MNKLFFMLLIVVGLIMLQIFLSNKKSRWLGLVLPFISLAISIMALLGVATFYSTGSVKVESVVQGEETNNDVMSTYTYKEDTYKTNDYPIGMLIYVFTLYNIPTLILLVIYKACREKQKKKLELEKMSIQDLE